MKKDVLVSIDSTHKDSEDTYSTKLCTQGTLEVSDGVMQLVYDETDEGLENCTTTVRAEPDGTVSVTRQGDFASQMIFKQDKRHVCHYITPAGELLMGIFARKVENSLTEQGGKIELNYTIDINADFASINDMCITVNEV